MSGASNRHLPLYHGVKMLYNIAVLQFHKIEAFVNVTVVNIVEGCKWVADVLSLGSIITSTYFANYVDRNAWQPHEIVVL